MSVVIGVTPGAAQAAPGDLDESFSTDGIASVPSGPGQVAVAPDGAVLVTGQIGAQEHTDIAVSRYRSDGELDRSFGTDGTARLDFGERDTATSMAVDSDGSILLAGDTDNRFLLARLTTNGVLDSSFAGDGTVDTGPEFGRASDLALTADERIVTVVAAVDSVVVMRLLSDGSVDTSFADGGVGVLPGATSSSPAVALGPDGSVFAAAPQLLKLHPDGALDQGFGSGGMASISRYIDDRVLSLVAQPDGQILAGLFSCSLIGPSAGCIDYAVRVSADGRSVAPIARGSALALAGDGGAVLAGPMGRRHLPASFGVRRFLPGGDLDTSFGRRGRAIAYADLAPVVARDVAVAPDRKVLVAGGTFSGERGVLARFDVAPGAPRDADADGLVDSRDRCPLGHARSRTGCRRLDRDLRLARGQRRQLEVTIDADKAACIYRSRIEIVAARPGKDRRVDAVTSMSLVENSLRVRLGNHAGRYYARVRSNRTKLARCSGARSASIRLR